ncbi:MAG: sigma-70 family RNA polymerase sigma factor [Clostridia bacterium]|nr:sigma-70 family RNA polymerase sigma factor [Clostridia bacterium]
MDDSRIIELLFERREEALAEIDQKYGEICHRVAHNILNNTADAEECVNDSYLGVWNSIPPNHPEQLLPYVCRIVRNLAAKRYHKNTAQKRNSLYDVALDELEECLTSPESPADDYLARETGEHINSFLGTLDKESRVIFVRRYWFSDAPEDIAHLVGRSKNYVAVKLSRTRNKLREYLRERGVNI